MLSVYVHSKHKYKSTQDWRTYKHTHILHVTVLTKKSYQSNEAFEISASINILLTKHFFCYRYNTSAMRNRLQYKNNTV